MILISQNNQSLIDLSIQATGSPLNWLKIALANALVPTAKVTPGMELSIPDGLVLNSDVARYYGANGIKPATALSDMMLLPQLSCEDKLYECFKP